jgi:3-oxoacyl-[acyl-carrier protein] reductase
MNLNLNDKYFLVIGATRGFGRAIAEALIEEGAKVIAVARTAEKLEELKAMAPGQVEIIATDVTIPLEQERMLNFVGNFDITGAVINAGGPPAKSVLETKLIDWDNAYKNLIRWKIRISKKLAIRFMSLGYGRMLFIESVSVKQPLDNMALSNAFRVAMVGYVKSLSREVAAKGLTMNVLAPGYHDTGALDRVVKKKAYIRKTPPKDAKKGLIEETLTGKLGDPKQFASLALWLLSEHSGNITGQTISVDGGMTKGLFG